MVVGSTSVQGQMHVQHDLPCQDACVSCVDDKHIVLAVADGLGSASQSDVGANIAVNAVVEFCRMQTAETININRLFRYCRAKILRFANQSNYREDDFHTTLLVALIGNEKSSFGQVGDGAIVVREDNGLQRLFAEHFIADRKPVNVTCSLLQSDYINHIQSHCCETKTIKQVFLMSDGVTPVAVNYALEQAYQPFFEYFSEYIIKPSSSPEIIPPRLGSFLASDAMSLHSDDDKAMAIFYADVED